LRVERDGKVLNEWKASKGEQVIKESTAQTISDILSDPSSSYMNRKSYFNIGGKIKVSTTAGVISDGATVGAVQHTSKYAVGFWAFSDQNQITGFSELVTLPPTYGWLTAAMSH
jgi:membrane peptidoglycan carboxypeptidase